MKKLYCALFVSLENYINKYVVLTSTVHIFVLFGTIKSKTNFILTRGMKIHKEKKNFGTLQIKM